LAKGLISNVIGGFLIALVLHNNIAAWTPASWGIKDVVFSPYAQIFQAAFFTWLGYFLPPLVNAWAWEKRPFALQAVHAGYYFMSLIVAGSIIVLMR
jgi:hypothetical protein